MSKLTEEATECIEAYDEAYEEGMDHEQGFDFASTMRDLIVNLVAELGDSCG